MRYIEEIRISHRLDPRFQNFISEIGTYLNKEVPLNHSIKTGWEEVPMEYLYQDNLIAV